MMRFILILSLLMFQFLTSTAQEKEEAMSQPKQYLVKLLGTRPTWPDDMTEDEMKVMSEHFMYLKKLTCDHKVVTAGPVFDFKFGLIILQVQSEDEAREIMANEPSVVKGLHTYEMSPMTVSLLRDYTPPDRFVAAPTGKAIVKEAIVTATINDVWNAWTTTEGVNTFFSPDAKVELRIGGPFEIYFDMSAPYGSRGSELCRVLSYLPEKMLSFEWNAPPSFGDLRGINTIVVLLFDQLENGQVKVTLTHHGWGEGTDWQGVYDYFDRAWGSVLGNFEKRFKEGPLMWE